MLVELLRGSCCGTFLAACAGWLTAALLLLWGLWAFLYCGAGRRDDLWSWFYMLVELLQGKLLWRENRAPGKRASGSDDEAKKTAHRMKLRALSDPNALFASGRCPGQSSKAWPRTALRSAPRPHFKGAATRFVGMSADDAGCCVHRLHMGRQEQQIAAVITAPRLSCSFYLT